MAYRLEPPKSHPVLRDPTIPYKATKRPRKFVSSSAAALTTARPTKLHIGSGGGEGEEGKPTVSHRSENNARKCLVGSKDRYDKKGRLRMVKFSKSTLAMHDSFDAKENAQQQQKKQKKQGKEDGKTEKIEREDENPTEKSEDEEEDESIMSRQNHDSDVEHDLVAHEEYHSNSASPEPSSRPSSPMQKKQTKAKVVVTDETCSNANTTTTKSFDNMYEDATFVTGARDLPLWVRSERKTGLQQILHEYFGNRYAISRWKRKKQVPEYDPRHFVDLF